MTERALATIRRISEIKPIEKADAIECAVIDGWTVVVKKNEYKVGDLCVYLEIDSWVPHTLAPFLTKPGHFPKVYNEVEGQRLRTVKLRGQLSQGLVLPLTEDIHILFAETFEHSYEARYLTEGDNVTEILGIQKWEKPLAACLAGIARGNFPSAVPKTDQERIQNLKRNLEQWVIDNDDWEITEKLDGSSCTIYLDNDGKFHVCSRNLDLIETEGNAFWYVARERNLEELMNQHALKGVALQGELIGWNIQGNQYGLAQGEYRFYVFDIYNTNGNFYLNSESRRIVTDALGLDDVPVIRIGKLPGHSVEELLKFAEGESRLNNSKREGLVYKNISDPSISFKTISNSWLIENKEETEDTFEVDSDSWLIENE